MLRPEVTIDSLHQRQVDTLPGRFGLKVTEIVEGRMRASLELQPWMMAPNGFLHAATVILLADSTAGYACIAHLPEGSKGFTTVELKSNFLGTAKSGVLATEAVAEHLGRTTQVWSATVYSPEGKKMALFRCTQMVLW
jgi:uncharacterized protein (TIGR00369 family)